MELIHVGKGAQANNDVIVSVFCNMFIAFRYIVIIKQVFWMLQLKCNNSYYVLSFVCIMGFRTDYILEELC